MAMTSMNVSLPKELKEYVEAQTKSGYSTPSEYVRELIRGDQKRRAKEKLEALLLEGLNSGDSIPVDAKFWSDLKQEALAKLKLRKNSSSRK
jgi:antitoxin ParD1/3/4